MTCWFDTSALCSPKSSRMTPATRPATVPKAAKVSQEVSMMTLRKSDDGLRPTTVGNRSGYRCEENSDHADDSKEPSCLST